MQIQIKKRGTGLVLYSGEHETTADAVTAAIKVDADLSGADLSGVKLIGAYLRGADLRDADLRDADLRDCNLRGADLSGANLRGAVLSPKEGTWNPKFSFGVDIDLTLPVKVAKAALREGALDMGAWHTCNTTHCLAGWAVHLSGPAGYALEKVTSPSVAGAILCPSASHLFYKSNEEALEWCRKTVAEAEKE